MSTDLRTAARRLYDARRDRDAIFGEDASGFGEPAWDMLLLLCAAEGPLRVSELISSVGSAAGTAALYVDWLTSRRLAILTDAGDVQIGSRGRDLFFEYLGGDR